MSGSIDLTLMILTILLVGVYVIFLYTSKKDDLSIKERHKLILSLKKAEQKLSNEGKVGIEEYRDEIIDLNKNIKNYEFEYSEMIIREIFHSTLSLVREEHISSLQADVFKKIIQNNINSIIETIKNNSIADFYLKISDLYFFDFDQKVDKYPKSQLSITSIEDINFTKHLISGVDCLLETNNFDFSEKLESYTLENNKKNIYRISPYFFFLYYWIKRNLRSVHSESFYTENFYKNKITTAFIAADDELLALDIVKATLGVLEGDIILFVRALSEYNNRPKIQHLFLRLQIIRYKGRICKLINNYSM